MSSHGCDDAVHYIYNILLANKSCHSNSEKNLCNIVIFVVHERGIKKGRDAMQVFTVGAPKKDIKKSKGSFFLGSTLT